MSFGRDKYRDQLYTETQSRVLVNIPRLTGSLSMLGSSIIIYIILKDSKKKLKRLYHRILLAYSCYDVVLSLNLALSATVVPKGTPGVWGAQGNWTTCEVSSFVTHFSFASGLYASFLCLYYMLVLRYAIREATIAKVEPFVHGVAFCVPLSFAIIMQHENIYSPANINVGWCFVNSYPMDCTRNDDVECTRGENYLGWLILVTAPFYVFFAIVAVSSILTFLKVWHVDNRASRWTMSSSSQSSTVHETAIQASLYICAFFLTYIWTGVLSLSFRSGVQANRRYYFPLVALSKIFLPLQGFMNFFIYTRPRYVALQRRHEERSRLDIVRSVIQGSVVLNSSPSRHTWQTQQQPSESASAGFVPCYNKSGASTLVIGDNPGNDVFVPESRHEMACSIAQGTTARSDHMASGNLAAENNDADS